MTGKRPYLALLAGLAIASSCASGVALAASRAQVTTGAGAATAVASDAQPPLRSRAALDAYLAANAGKATPLDILPPLARHRFLDSIAFRPDTLGGFDPTELATELTRDEIVRVLDLFGASEFAAMVKPRFPDTPPPWRGSHDRPGKVATGFDELARLQSKAGDPAQLHDRFEAMFGDLLRDPAAVAALPDRELVYLLRATELASRNPRTAADADRLDHLVAALERRGMARPADDRLVLNALLESGAFGRARNYASDHPGNGLPQLPSFQDPLGSTATGPTVWQPANDGQTLVRVPVDLGPTQVLVIAGCHISVDAAEDISGDPVLGPVFKAHARWLMLPPGQEDLDAFRDWNRDLPGAPAILLHNRKEWSILPEGWSTPIFLIVRGGKVIQTIIGWPRNPAENRPVLIDALQHAGLLAPEAGNPSPAQGVAASSR